MHKTAVTALTALVLGIAPAAALADPPPGVPPAPDVPGAIVPVTPQATPTPTPAATPAPESPAPAAPAAVTAPPAASAPPSVAPAVHPKKKHKRHRKPVRHHHKHKRHIRAHAASGDVPELAPGQFQCTSGGLTFGEPAVAAYGTDIFASDQFTAHRSLLVRWNDATGSPEVVATGGVVFGFVDSYGFDGDSRWMVAGNQWVPYSTYQLYPAPWRVSTHGWYAVYEQAMWNIGGSTGWIAEGTYALTPQRAYWCQI